MRKKPLVLFILIDGARPDVMRGLMESGDLPNIAGMVSSEGTFRTAITCCPSTTGPAYLPFLTGCFPGTVNIPGIRWLDKEEYARRRFGLYRFRSYNGIEAPLLNRDLPTVHPTLFELFERSYNIYSPLSRGIENSRNLTARSKPFHYLYAHLTDDWRAVDSHASHYLMRALESNPEFVYAVFPGVDSYSHLNHPRHDKAIAEYKFIDRAIGDALELLRRQKRLDNTLVIITSDHGLTATHTHLDLAQFLQRRGINTLYYPLIWKRHPKASVMISGNALGMVYWLDGCPVEDINGAVAELIENPVIDLIISKRGDGEFGIVSGRGEAAVKSADSLYSYIPISGDPLGYGGPLGPISQRESLVVTFDSEYPDAMVQIAQVFGSPRCGDLVVISKNGYDLRRAFEWPEHHASHGSLCREHMTVPVIYNQIGWRPGPMRTTDLFNTMLKWAGKPTLDNTDGESLI
jgi:arylsulfatase A-like enzyme